MANITVKPDEVRSQITTFESRRNDFESSVHNMQQAVASLESLWTGMGYNAYQETMGQWNSDVQRILTDLANINQQTRNAIAEYEAQDQSAASQLGGLSV